MMQVKIFSIPIYGGEEINDDMNRFLRSKKVMSIESELVKEGGSSYWSFCVKYIEGGKVQYSSSKEKVDYSKKLDKDSFERYQKMRDIRKKIAKEEGIPAYLVLTNEEMAALASIEDLTLGEMKKVKGIGGNKIEKYGRYFVPLSESDDQGK